jgi:outer membrane protein assembly factor BamB
MAYTVTTRAYDNLRSGANTQETVLTPDAVAARGMRRLLRLRLIGDARGTESQPLVVPGVRLEDGTQREVVYLATMANQVWAYDAADGTLVWVRALGRPVKGSRAIDAWLINDHWGILSTPVIDVERQALYAVGWTSPDQSPEHGRHMLFGLSLVDGRLLHPPLDLETATYDPGHGLPVQRFASATRKQRAALLLTHAGGRPTVFIGFGSLRETDETSRGWIVACDVEAWHVSAAWASTARGHGAGIWHAGAGLASDAQGAIYAMTGNGDFDGVTDFGESFVKLSYSPGADGTPAAFRLIDWWTPWTDAARAGRPGEPAIARAETVAATNLRAAAPAMGPEWEDMDLGSGGPVLVPSAGAVVGAGKDGVLYVLDSAAFGRTMPADLDHAAANYARLKSPPIFFTYYPGTTPSPAPDHITDLNLLWGDRTHHQHGSPVHWTSPEHGPSLYNWGENGNLRAWAVDAAGAVSYLACGAEQASAGAPIPPGGMPGGTLVLSANGTQPHSGIVWATIPYLDANQKISPGRLLAYDATEFGAFGDGSGQLRVLWDSESAGIAFVYNKFNPPVVANGRLFVPTYDGHVDVYTLA